MRLQIALLATLMVSGCKTPGDIRKGPVIASGISQRSVADIAGCIALESTGRGIEIGKEPLPNGMAVTLAMRAAGIKTVTGVYDIEDVGGSRRVSVHAVGAKRKEPLPISGKAASCL